MKKDLTEGKEEKVKEGKVSVPGRTRLETVKLILEILAVVVTLIGGIASVLTTAPGLTLAVAVTMVGGIAALIWRMK